MPTISNNQAPVNIYFDRCVFGNHAPVQPPSDEKKNEQNKILESIISIGKILFGFLGGL